MRFVRVGQVVLFWQNMAIWRIGEYVCGDSSFTAIHKEPDSKLTSIDSEIKCSLNDSNLRVIGFSNFSIGYETYALTLVILFVMTGLQNIEKIRDEKIRKFILKGINSDTNKRYQNVDELKAAFNETF